MKKRASRRKVPAIITAVVGPLVARLTRIEDLLFEMRHEQDVKLKRLTGVREQLDGLADQMAASRVNLRRMLQRATRAAGQRNRSGKRRRAGHLPGMVHH